MSTGALLFMVGSWAFVLGLTLWSFVLILKIQARKARTPDPADDLTRTPVPPTA